MSFRSAPAAASALNSFPSLIVSAYSRHRLTTILNISSSMVAAISPQPLTAAANAWLAAFLFSSSSLEGSLFEFRLALAFKFCTKKAHVWINLQKTRASCVFLVHSHAFRSLRLASAFKGCRKEDSHCSTNASSAALSLLRRFTQVMGKEMNRRPHSFLRISLRSLTFQAWRWHCWPNSMALLARLQSLSRGFHAIQDYLDCLGVASLHTL